MNKGYIFMSSTEVVATLSSRMRSCISNYSFMDCPFFTFEKLARVLMAPIPKVYATSSRRHPVPLAKVDSPSTNNKRPAVTNRDPIISNDQNFVDWARFRCLFLKKIENISSR